MRARVQQPFVAVNKQEEDCNLNLVIPIKEFNFLSPNRRAV